MNDSQNIILTAQNQDGDSLVLTMGWDTDLSGLVDAFRAIAFWLTYQAQTIDEYLPDPLREWSYDDEREPDEPGPEGGC